MTQKTSFDVALQTLRQPCKAERIEKDGESSQPLTSQSLFKFIGTDDIEKYPPGCSIAALQDTNDNLLMFRSFNQLQCRTLHHLQSEISHLEKDLQDLDTLDSKSPKLMYRLRSGKREEGWDQAKRDIFRELETKFQTYNDLLLKVRELTKLRNIPMEPHRSLFHYMVNNEPLDKDDSEDWYYHVEDLVMLAESDNVDSTFAFAFGRIKNALAQLFHKNSPTLPISKYPPPPSLALTAASRATSTTLAVGVLLIPVFLLLWISMNRFWKSATVSISMIIFAFLMASFPNVGTKDVLLATAAYCAVLATCLGSSQLG